MSGKFEKKKAGKSKILLALIAVAAVLLVAVCFFLRKENAEPEGLREDQTVLTEQAEQTELTEPPRISLKNDMEILDIGAYTGIYMEDGTDEVVSGVLMMKIINNGQDTIEYARITMDIGEEMAEFNVSTLKPGATIVLLEKNRMAYDKTVDYTATQIICENLALFQEPLSIHEDKISIQILDGAINVSNISAQDIPGRISIYYKNKAAGIYYGGITYRITLENGLKANEIRQVMASHFSDTGSEIVFVTIN
ncbi:MAG: hypothetical protein IKU68_02570 [Oscillospiraceae bacterium]|nr:hypothetical protein [Oscillospiraceae bacterium]